MSLTCLTNITKITEDGTFHATDEKGGHIVGNIFDCLKHAIEEAGFPPWLTHEDALVTAYRNAASCYGIILKFNGTTLEWIETLNRKSRAFPPTPYDFPAHGLAGIEIKPRRSAGGRRKKKKTRKKKKISVKKKQISVKKKKISVKR